MVGDNTWSQASAATTSGHIFSFHTFTLCNYRSAIGSPINCFIKRYNTTSELDVYNYSVNGLFKGKLC